MNELLLNGKPHDLDHLATAPLPSDCSDYDKRVLQFCQQWLSGQEEFVVHTSGSTGQPKPIVLTRSQMATSAHLTGQAIGLQPGDRALMCLGLDYIAGLMMVVRGFELGLRLVIMDPVSRPLAHLPHGMPIDFTAMVPLQVQETLAGSAEELATLNAMQAVLIGGGPVSVALQAKLQPLQAPIYHTYGMTETVTHIALKRLNGPQRSDYFVPFAGVELGLDGRGCLTICSTVTRGETVTTNDLVELRPDHTFRWLGRVDNVINSGGVKIQVEKVETALETVLYAYRDGIFADRRFFVGPLDHPRYGQAVVAVIEGAAFGGNDPMASAIEQEVRGRLQPLLKRYEIPRHIYFVDRLVETRLGKIDRSANVARLAAADPAVD